MSNAHDLYISVQSRPRPEDVAALVSELLGSRLSAAENQVLNVAVRGSFKHNIGAYSSMAADFRRTDGAEKQVKVGADLFALPVLTAAECLDTERVQQFMYEASAKFGKAIGANDFKADRLTRSQRITLGATKGHRAYNKRFRFLARLEDKINRMLRSDMKTDHSRMAKSAFATHLAENELLSDLPTACFVAYMSARMNLRSQFTNGPQIRAYDNIAQMLYNHAKRGNPNWWAIAHVFPESEVLGNLSDTEKARLMSLWFDALCGIANFLKETAKDNDLNTATMIVRRGQDSSTWNATAGAWNKVRMGWIGLLHAMGAEGILDKVCPGKVLRLMAADVARWHGGLHPDTKVWAELPAPWLVFNGDADCPRELVEAVCDKHGVDRKGWTTPRDGRHATAYTPTPELVHGVTVYSPALAKVLRKAGFFSGK